MVMVLEISTPDDDPRPRGGFEDTWEALLANSQRIPEVVVDLTALGILQRFDFTKEPGSTVRGGLAWLPSLSVLSAKTMERLKYLASWGGNLSVFFRTTDIGLVARLEQAMNASAEPTALPRLSAAASRYVSELETNGSYAVAFAHDGEPVYCIGVTVRKEP